MGNALSMKTIHRRSSYAISPRYLKTKWFICDPYTEEFSMYDLKNLAKLKALDANAPEAMKAFWAFDKAAMAAGAIPVKYKELMALAVAFTTQCAYCIDIHAKKARAAEATEQEIAEVVVIAAALRAGAAITHGAHAMP
jgi:AhpD family alkylhydroperoxidase